MLFRSTVAMTLLSLASGAKIAMKPFEDPSMLSTISGIYFEPVVSTDNYCDESSIPRNCGGKIDVDLSADSNIEFEWIASESMDKYISVSSPTGTFQFGKYHISLLHLSVLIQRFTESIMHFVCNRISCTISMHRRPISNDRWVKHRV